MIVLRWIIRFLHAPKTLLNIGVDRLLSPVYFAAYGIKTGIDMRIVGLPILSDSRNGFITIGDRVTLFSRPTSNPLYIYTPCSFHLLKRDAQIEIGNDVAMSGTIICSATKVTVGHNVMIGANCIVIDTDFHPLAPEMRRTNPIEGAKSSPIIIENDVFIGTGSVILKGTIIGAGCVVGAKSVVSGVFPPRSIIAGNPAKVIKALKDNSI